MKHSSLCLLALSLLFWAWISPARSADPEPSDPVYPVDWRGTSLRSVLDDLSRHLGLAYVIDSAAPQEALDQRLRLQADHLTRQQALRWAARLAGLEAVVRDDTIFIASPDRLPRLWRLSATPATSPAGLDQFQALEQTRASITWIDAPLSSIGRDVSANFGIDVVFHRELLAEEGLVHLESAEASLATIRQAMEAQLKTKVYMYDGAVWVVPEAVSPDVPATQPSAVQSLPAAPDRPVPGLSPLDQFVILDKSVTTWPALSSRLSRAAGVACRVTPGVGVFGVPWQAQGTIGEVLDAARLLGRLAWRLVPPGRDEPAAIEIRSPAAKAG
jgi:type II secretory pathway component GspD/PulD (secretin)